MQRRLHDRGKREVLRTQSLHEERDQGGKPGGVRWSLLQGRQVQVLDLQPKVSPICNLLTSASMHYAEVVMENGIWFSRPF